MNKADRLARAARARALLGMEDTDGRASQAPVAVPDGRVRREPAPGKRSKNTTVRPVDSPAVEALADERIPAKSGTVVQDSGPKYTPLTPKVWTGSPPVPGDIVFYHNERYWVEPPIAVSLLESPWIRIGDHRVPRERHPNGEWGLAKNRLSFKVHVDELTLSPVQQHSAASPLPTVASVARQARARAGLRDVGDEIATLLRSCNTLQQTYSCAAEYLGVPVDDLQRKYGHLNPGQQRMNLGNKMRFKWKREHGL